MKTLTLIISLMLSSSAIAGEVSMSSAAHLPSESTSMGAGSAAQWVIPLIAIALIALAVSNQEDSCNPKVEKCMLYGDR